MQETFQSKELKQHLIPKYICKIPLFCELNCIRLGPLCFSFEESLKITSTGMYKRFIFAINKEKSIPIFRKYNIHIPPPPSQFIDYSMFVGSDTNFNLIKVYYQQKNLKNKSGEFNIICHTIDNVNEKKLYYTLIIDNPIAHTSYYIKNEKLKSLLENLFKYYFPQKHYCLQTVKNSDPYAFHIKLFGDLKVIHVSNILYEIIQSITIINSENISKYLKSIEDYYITWISINMDGGVNIYYKYLCSECDN